MPRSSTARKSAEPDRSAAAHRQAGLLRLSTEIAAVVQERALYSLLAPVERVTGWDTIVPLKRTEAHYIPDPERIVAAAQRTLSA